jgi:hypothetical protein
MKPIKIKLRKYQLETFNVLITNCFYKCLTYEMEHIAHYENLRDLRKEVNLRYQTMLMQGNKDEYTFCALMCQLQSFEAMLNTLTINDEEGALLSSIYIKIAEATTEHNRKIRLEINQLLSQLQ